MWSSREDRRLGSKFLDGWFGDRMMRIEFSVERRAMTRCMGFVGLWIFCAGRDNDG